MKINPTRHNYLFEWPTRKEIKEGMAKRSRYIIQSKLAQQDELKK